MKCNKKQGKLNVQKDLPDCPMNEGMVLQLEQNKCIWRRIAFKFGIASRTLISSLIDFNYHQKIKLTLVKYQCFGRILDEQFTRNDYMAVMETVVAVAVGILSTIFLVSLVALILVCRHRYCRQKDYISQQLNDTRFVCRL